jgi:hypothetical protein
MLLVIATTTDLVQAFEKYGWNRHIWDIPPEMMVQARKV